MCTGWREAFLERMLILYSRPRPITTGNDVRGISSPGQSGSERIATGSGLTTSTVLANAGRSRIRGWEMELQTVPIDGLDVRLTYGWIDSDFVEFIAVDTDRTVSASLRLLAEKYGKLGDLVK